MANSATMSAGKRLVTIGLLLQIIFFGIFVASGGLFHYRILRTPTPVSQQVKWQKYIYALYFSSALILIRSVFRLIEFNEGNDGFIMRKEVFLYIFDAVFMLAVVVCFNVVHPGLIIGRNVQRSEMQLSSREESGNRTPDHRRK